MGAEASLMSTVPARRDTIWRGVREGAVPLGVATLWVLLTLGALALVRALTSGQGFAAEDTAVLITTIAGLVLAAVAYAVSCVWALRRAVAWQRTGYERQAAAAFWTLSATALVVLLPALIGMLLPQHPAP